MLELRETLETMCSNSLPQFTDEEAKGHRTDVFWTSKWITEHSETVMNSILFDS